MFTLRPPPCLNTGHSNDCSFKLHIRLLVFSRCKLAGKGSRKSVQTCSIYEPWTFPGLMEQFPLVLRLLWSNCNPGSLALSSQQILVSSSQPISNLHFLSKVLERIVADQTINHLMMHNLFQPFQSGFRTFYSTETAVTRVVNDLLLTIHSNASSLLMVLDLSAALNTIDHSILLHRLKPYVGLKVLLFAGLDHISQIERNLFSVKNQNTET